MFSYGITSRYANNPRGEIQMEKMRDEELQFLRDLWEEAGEDNTGYLLLGMKADAILRKRESKEKTKEG